MKLSCLFQKYRLKRLRGASFHTINQYNVTMRLFSEFLGHIPTTGDLVDSVVSEFCWSRVEAGRSPATAEKNGSNLCALWRFACRQGLVEKWPDVSLPTEPERTPIAWMQDELHRLFKACQDERGYYGDVPRRDWWNVLHAILWDTGERIGAVRQIRTSLVSLSLNEGWITIPAESRKWKKRDKAWRLHPDSVLAIRRIYDPSRELLLPFPHDTGTLYNHYRKILKRAGLPHDRKHKFHCLRKSVGSYFEAAGGNATELLDHSSRSVTKAYLDPRIVQSIQASDLLFRPGA